MYNKSCERLLMMESQKGVLDSTFKLLRALREKIPKDVPFRSIRVDFEKYYSLWKKIQLLDLYRKDSEYQNFEMIEFNFEFIEYIIRNYETDKILYKTDYLESLFEILEDNTWYNMKYFKSKVSELSNQNDQFNKNRMLKLCQELSSRVTCIQKIENNKEILQKQKEVRKTNALSELFKYVFENERPFQELSNLKPELYEHINWYKSDYFTDIMKKYKMVLDYSHSCNWDKAINQIFSANCKM